MGKASLTIAISGEYNSKAVAKAKADLEKLKTTAASQMGGVSSALVNAGAKMAEFGGQVYSAGEKMSAFGTKLTKGVTLPIVAAAAACASAAIDIDDSLTSVKKTVDGTEEQYQSLKQAAIEFSKTNAVSASQILDIQSLGAQLGFAIDELDEFSRVTSGLDIATNMDAETAATEMAQFANITKMAHTQVSNYASAIVGLGNNMATTESDISSMAMRIAAAGTQVGMSQADILGLAAALSSLGVEAEAGGTAISTIMSTIDKAVATNSESLADWAATAKMSSQDFAEAWKNDPVAALSQLLSSMEETTAEGGNMSVMLEELGIDSIRQTDIMKRMAGNSELVAKAVALSNDEWEKNTALQNEVDNRNASLSSQLEMLKNRVTAVAEEVGVPLVNAALDFVDATEPVIQKVEEAAEAFSNLDEDEQKQIVSMVAAAAAFGPVITVVGKLTSGTGSLIVMLGKGVQKLGVLTSGLNSTDTATLKAKASTTKLTSAQEASATATTKATKATKLLNAACKATAIGLLVDLAAQVNEEFSEWFDRAQLVQDATTGLSSSVTSLDTAYSAAVLNIEPFTVAVDNNTVSLTSNALSAEDCLQAQADLASSMTTTFQEIGTNSAMVDYYSGVITKLSGAYDENGNKIKLTRAEQEKLRDAVANFNELTGSNIEILDAENGRLSDNANSILAVADAYKQEAQAEAARALYSQVTQQLIQDQLSLEEATNKLSEAEEGFGIWIGDFPVIADEASVNYHQLKSDVDDLQSATDSATTTQSKLLDMITNSTGKFDTLDSALASCGVAMSDFGELSEEQLNGLQTDFDGSLSSIVTSCNNYGIQVPQSLADGINANASTATDAATQLGANMDAGTAAGLNSGEALEAAETSSESILDKIKNFFGIHSPSTVMQEIGQNIDQGLANGISNNASTATTSMGNVSTGVLNQINGLPSSARSIGSNASSQFASGIGSGSSNANSQGRTVANQAKSGISSVSANQAGANFTQGFSSGMSSVNLYNVAWNLGKSALSAIKGALGIASPSKEAKKVGAWFGEGAVIGMQSTEKDIENEADRMSEAMSLNPTLGISRSGNNSGIKVSGGTVMNISLNVTVTDAAASAVEAGKNIAAGLYTEWARRERTFA
jgi:TP901 family phage tail tape measure protein